MAHEWFELIKFTDNQDFVIEKIRLKQKDITILRYYSILVTLMTMAPLDVLKLISFLC